MTQLPTRLVSLTRFYVVPILIPTHILQSSFHLTSKWHERILSEHISKIKILLVLFFWSIKISFCVIFYSFKNTQTDILQTTCFVKHLKYSRFLRKNGINHSCCCEFYFLVLLNVVKINNWLNIMRSIGNENSFKVNFLFEENEEKIIFIADDFQFDSHICDCSYKCFRALIALLLCLHVKSLSVFYNREKTD